MVSFTLGKLFRTKWVWFASPTDVEQADEVVFLDYRDGKYPGFRRKEGVTSIIDLTKSEDELWEAMRDKFIRKQIRRGEISGIVVREGTLADFMPLYRSLREGKRLEASDLRPIAQAGRILIAWFSGRPIAGGLFVGDGVSVRAYALASTRFATQVGHDREIIGYGSRMILWEAMRIFKREGYQSIDLGGVNPDSTNPEDHSLVEFKEAFGGIRTPYYFYRKTYSPFLRWFRLLKSFSSL